MTGGNYITLIKAVSPPVVGKHFSMVNGTERKRSMAYITKGVAETRVVPDAETMVALLREVTERDDIVICPGLFHGATVGVPFDIVTKRGLASMLGLPGEDHAPGGVQNIKGKLVAARIKDGISPSCWALCDADDPEGIPAQWSALDIGQRLALLEKVVPGLSACERILARSSSARVLRPGAAPGHHSHAWIRLSDPQQLERLRIHLQVHTVLEGLSFLHQKKSRATGAPIGIEHRTVIDTSVFQAGRLVFCSKPSLDQTMTGCKVVDAGITVENAGIGALKLNLPMHGVTTTALHSYRSKTNIKLAVSRSKNGNLNAHSVGQLRLDTMIEQRGGAAKRLVTGSGEMAPGSKLRCDTPFRYSASGDAAFIGWSAAGVPMLHDSGTSTTYHLDKTEQANYQFSRQHLGGNGQTGSKPGDSHPLRRLRALLQHAERARVYSAGLHRHRAGYRRGRARARQDDGHRPARPPCCGIVWARTPAGTEALAACRLHRRGCRPVAAAALRPRPL